MDASRQSALPQHRLQPRDLVQARGLLDHVLQPLLLLLRELDPRHPSRETTASGRGTTVATDGRRGDVERLRLDPHELRCQLRRVLGRAEQLLRPLPLRVLDLCVVQEPYRPTSPNGPIPVVLQKIVPLVS